MISNVLWCLAAYAVVFLISAKRANKFDRTAWEKGLADGEAAAVKEIVKE